MQAASENVRLDFLEVSNGQSDKNFSQSPLHDNRRRGLRNIGKIRRHRLCKQHIFIFRAADLRVCNMARYRNGDNLYFKQPQTAVRSPVVVHAADAFGILYFFRPCRKILQYKSRCSGARLLRVRSQSETSFFRSGTPVCLWRCSFSRRRLLLRQTR